MIEDGAGFFLVDKPLTWSSFHVVNKIKYYFKYLAKKEVKIGHAGTLDPMASGLLIVCYGAMTKKIHTFQDLPKEYIGEIILGANRPSHDLETEISEEFPIDHVSAEIIAKAAKALEGEQEQVAPDFSAKKIDGKRAYSLARQGIRPNAASHKIIVEAFETEFEAPETVRFKIRCSKGTYIRSMAYDLGCKLNTGAYLSELRRTAIGEYRIENALTLEELEEQFKGISK